MASMHVDDLKSCREYRNLAILQFTLKWMKFESSPYRFYSL